MNNSLSVQLHPLQLLRLMIFSKFEKKSTRLSPLPISVEDYQLLKELDSGELVKPHRIGIYKNKQGLKAVVKWWTGSTKNFAANSLMHEVSMTKLFSKLHLRISKDLSTELSHIDTPRLITSKTNNQSVLIMTEFKSGKLLSETRVENQIREYNLALHYLNKLSESLAFKDFNALPKRKVKDYLFLYPALLAVACLRQAKYIPTFLKGVPFALLAFLKIRNQPLTLVHRDLHTKNILFSSKETTIIDLQRVVLTYGLYELVTTLAVEWNKKHFRNAILSSVPAQSLKVFRGLMVHFATHALTANNLPEYYLTRYKAMLKFAVNDFTNYYKKIYEN